MINLDIFSDHDSLAVDIRMNMNPMYISVFVRKLHGRFNIPYVNGSDAFLIKNRFNLLNIYLRYDKEILYLQGNLI